MSFVAVSIGEAAKPRVVYRGSCKTSCFLLRRCRRVYGEVAKPRAFCYVDVAVSIGEAATPRVFCGRVYRGSCKTSCLFATWMSPCL